MHIEIQQIKQMEKQLDPDSTTKGIISGKNIAEVCK